MRKIFTLLFLSTLLFSSCSSDDDHIHETTDNDTIARTFEITRTFNTGNNFRVEAVVPDNVTVFDADVPLVYILDPDLSASENGDVWEPLPKTFNFDAGGFATFGFNFIFDEQQNKASIEIVLESDDLGALDASITQNQVFRIVIVPSSFAENTTVDLSDLNAVQNALKFNL